MNDLTQMRRWMMLMDSAGDIRKIKITQIDVAAAARHFDLPHDNLSRREMIERMKGVRDEFADLVSGETTLTLYRGVDVAPDDAEVWGPIAQGRANVGQSWSLHREPAAVFASPDGIILTCEIALRDIDWQTTIAVNALSESESELVVRQGSAMTIRAIDTVLGDPPPSGLLVGAKLIA